MAGSHELTQGSTNEFQQSLTDMVKASVDPFAGKIKKLITVDEELKPGDDGFEIITTSKNYDTEIYPKDDYINSIAERYPKDDYK